MGGDNSLTEVDLNTSFDSFNGEFLNYNDDLKLDLQAYLTRIPSYQFPMKTI